MLENKVFRRQYLADAVGCYSHCFVCISVTVTDLVHVPPGAQRPGCPLRETHPRRRRFRVDVR
jgi:hypothetical protein